MPCPYGFVDTSCGATFIGAAVDMAVGILLRRWVTPSRLFCKCAF